MLEQPCHSLDPGIHMAFELFGTDVRRAPGIRLKDAPARAADAAAGTPC